MSRQREYTAKQIVDAIHMAEGVVKDAADSLGCSRTTIYRYAAEYVTVERAIRQAREPLVLEARGWMREMMRNPDHKDHYKAVKDVLVVYDDEMDWSDKERREHSGDGFNITINPPSDGDD